MLRPLLVLVAVSACASSAPGKRVSAPAIPPQASGAPGESTRASDAPTEHDARLAPPFGGTAGVRRVKRSSDAAPDAARHVVAAAAPRD